MVEIKKNFLKMWNQNEPIKYSGIESNVWEMLVLNVEERLFSGWSLLCYSLKKIPSVFLFNSKSIIDTKLYSCLLYKYNKNIIELMYGANLTIWSLFISFKLPQVPHTNHGEVLFEWIEIEISISLNSKPIRKIFACYLREVYWKRFRVCMSWVNIRRWMLVG